MNEGDDMDDSYLDAVPLPQSEGDYYDGSEIADVDLVGPQPPLRIAIRDGLPAERDPARPVVASPFVWRDPATIPPRRWLWGKHLLRKFVSMDVAPGGVGKSSLKIVEALAMTTGKNILGQELPEGRLRVWLYNLEDPHEETERRLAAAAQMFHIKPADAGDRLFVDSGRTQRCVIAEETPNGATILRPIVESIVAEITERQIDVLILDPFVSSHALSENDNRAMDLVAKEWGAIAERCNCSINLVHHVRKTNGEEATADSARGAKAVVDAARSVLVYNRMTKDEAKEANVPPEQARFYFRTVNDKANLAPVEGSTWYRMNNVDLPNGDSVGVATPWKWPDMMAGVNNHKLREIQAAVADGNWRENVQAGEAWVGRPIARVLDLDPDDVGARKRIGKMVKEWVKSGVLQIVHEQDEKRRDRPFVRVGTPVAPP